MAICQIDDHSPEADLEALVQEEMKVERPGIYSITNKDSGKVYVGSAVSLSRRFGEHLRMLRRNDHENRHLQNSWNQHGERAFSFTIERFCDAASLVEHEQRYIDSFKEKVGWENMYNMNPQASSCLGMKHAQESLAKMSRQQSGDGNGFHGKTHSPEARERISAANKGKVAWNTGLLWPEEVKERISRAKMGQKAWNAGLTKDTDERVKQYADKQMGRERWKDTPHPRGMAGKRHSEEAKARIAETCREKAKNRLRGAGGAFVAVPKVGPAAPADPAPPSAAPGG